MTENAISLMATGLATVVSLAGVAYAFFWLYRDVCVDTFRDKVFALRDELFLDAADGLVPFDHPAYTTLRTTMNGFIRFGDGLSLTQILVCNVFVRPEDAERAGLRPFEERWDKATNDLPASSRKRLDVYLSRLNRLAALYVVLGSPVVVLSIVGPLVVWFAVRRWFGGVRASFVAWLSEAKGTIDHVDSAALAEGSPRGGYSAPW
jgi:hypothetical protein